MSQRFTNTRAFLPGTSTNPDGPLDLTAEPEVHTTITTPTGAHLVHLYLVGWAGDNSQDLAYVLDDGTTELFFLNGDPHADETGSCSLAAADTRTLGLTDTEATELARALRDLYWEVRDQFTTHMNTIARAFTADTTTPAYRTANTTA